MYEVISFGLLRKIHPSRPQARKGNWEQWGKSHFSRHINAYDCDMKWSTPKCYRLSHGATLRRVASSVKVHNRHRTIRQLEEPAMCLSSSAHLSICCSWLVARTFCWDVSLKLTFDLLDTKCPHFIVLSLLETTEQCATLWKPVANVRNLLSWESRWINSPCKQIAHFAP